MSRKGLMPGDSVTLWARTAENVILVLGHGLFQGTQWANGKHAPVVKLDDNREIVVPYDGVAIGHDQDVEASCNSFPGKVFNWSLDKYAKGELPAEAKPAEIAPAVPAQPKTATDKLLYLKKEIEIEEKKIQLYERQIEASRSIITGKRSEIQAIRKAVLDEIAAFDGFVDPPSVTPPPAPPKPPPVVVPVPVTQEEAFDNAAARAALED